MKGIMPGIVDMLQDVRIIGLGDPKRIEQFAWSAAPNFSALSLHSGPLLFGRAVAIAYSDPFLYGSLLLRPTTQFRFSIEGRSPQRYMT